MSGGPKVPRDPGWRARERARWRAAPRARPKAPPAPGPGEESVWDYPRPPRVEAVRRRVHVALGGAAVADSVRALRVCETASPPVVYVPREDVRPGALERSGTETFCEWKGVATYYHVRAGASRAEEAAWSYEEPEAGFEAIGGFVAFHPARLECFLDAERVRPQEGGYYGGWITEGILGPFKGAPGTGGW